MEDTEEVVDHRKEDLVVVTRHLVLELACLKARFAMEEDGERQPKVEHNQHKFYGEYSHS